MQKYGQHSIRMLHFLKNHPGSTSSEINEMLFENTQPIDIATLRLYHFNHEPYLMSIEGCHYDDYLTKDTHWLRNYYKVELVKRENIPQRVFRRGKFSYLLSPYYSRTLASCSKGMDAHPNCVHQSGNRRWFWRSMNDKGRYQYFLTLRGYGATKINKLPSKAVACKPGAAVV
jgi:hypothetical protein